MRNLFITVALVVTAACGPEIQTTSGKAYLAQKAIDDPEVAAAAAFDPSPLEFPARIGLIRFVHGEVATFPAKERDLLISSFPQAMGTLVQLGALEAGLSSRGRLRNTEAKRIRTLAASRHLDYVLVLSLDPYANTAEALFLNVRTGYPHGSIEAVGFGRGISNAFGNRPSNPNRLNRSTLKLTRALKPQLDDLASRLFAISQ